MLSCFPVFHPQSPNPITSSLASKRVVTHLTTHSCLTPLASLLWGIKPPQEQKGPPPTDAR